MKKYILIIAAVIILIGSVFVFVYNSPDVFIAVTKPVEETELYFEQVIVGGNGHFNLPVPKYIKNRLDIINDETQKTEREIFKKYESADIKTEISVENGQTIVVYYGTAVNKQTKEKEDFNKKITFDFVATKNILN